MSNVANFMRLRKSKDGSVTTKPVKPTKELIMSFVNAGEWGGLPKLCGVSRMPIVRHDGSIHNEPGYDPVSCAYYDEVDRVVIPEHPTRDDATRAASVLCDSLCDFPFAGADDCNMHYQSNMIGFEVSTAFLFADIGHIPMLVIDAPRRGTGKSLLTQHGGVIMTGEQVGSVSVSGDDGE